MANIPRTPNSRHRPQQEDRKEAGRNYGGPRREPHAEESSKPSSPVSEIFADPRYNGTWSAKTDARTKAERETGTGLGVK